MYANRKVRYHSSKPIGTVLSPLCTESDHCVITLIFVLFSAGAFMGFDSELEDSGSECDIEGQKATLAANLRAAAIKPSFVDPTDHLPIFEDQLLDGLQLWLDRLFEGSTYRYHINYWPEFPISPSNFNTRQLQG